APPDSPPFFFSFPAPPPASPYTLSLHDALPIFGECVVADGGDPCAGLVDGECDALLGELGEGGVVGRLEFGDAGLEGVEVFGGLDRKSTRLNSSHLGISYAVFCLKKKK